MSRILYWVMAAGLALGLGSAAPVAAATNDQIVFTKTENNQTNIWLMNSDGSNKRALTKAGATQPAWSPTGKKLAYIDSSWGINRLVIANANGAQAKALALNVSTDDKPAWSLDGKHIAFVKQIGDKSAIFSTTTNGDTKNVSGWSRQYNYRSASFAPDGKRIVYQQYGADGSRLLIKNLVNSHVRTLTDMSDNIHARAVWSPNGKKILFSDSSDLVYTIWSDGSHRAVISDGESYHASWSPDGSKIVFIEDAGDDFISISEADGTVVWVPVNKGEYREIGAPTWSADGTSLLLTLQYSNSTTQVSDIFSMNLADSPQVVHLASGNLGHASWQP